MSSRVTVLIADDEPLVAHLYEARARAAGFLVRRSVSNLPDLLAALEANPPDILVLDAVLSGVEIFYTLPSLRHDYWRMRILVAAPPPGGRLVEQALACGCEGFLLKSRESDSELILALRRLGAGGSHVSDAVRDRDRRPRCRLVKRLTHRQYELFARLRAGQSYVEVARAMRSTPQSTYRMARRLKKAIGFGDRAKRVPWRTIVLTESEDNTLRMHR